MNVLLAEDEVLAAERLTAMLKDCEPNVHITERLDSVEEIVDFFKSGKSVDLLLLDIQLADGKSFEAFNQVNIDHPIIFTTAYDQYAIQAFQHFSIDYLLKPIRKTELSRAIEKYKKLSLQKPQFPLEELTALLKKKESGFKERFLIRAGNKLQFKATQDVAFFYADGKVVFLVTKGEGKKYIIDHTLEDLEASLDPSDFFRVSRKHIVNIACISEVSGIGNARLDIKLSQKTEQQLTVSRNRIQSFKNWLNR